jgi:hypothetical protein
MRAAVQRVKAKKTVHIHSIKKGHQGLCMLCKNFSGCTYSRDPKIAVLQCEEFEGEGPFTRKDILNPLSSSIARSTSPSILGKRRTRALHPKGLCGLCEDRGICTFPKPEGGVWHCEEYR